MRLPVLGLHNVKAAMAGDAMTYNFTSVSVQGRRRRAAISSFLS